MADSNPCCVDAECTDGSARDRGVSLIEILIAVVLLGLGVTAMLGTLMVTIQASATERDHANAHAWLQTASDALYRVQRMQCGTDGAVGDEQAVRAFYQQEIRDLADNPEGWPDANLEVVASPTPELHAEFRRAIEREADDPEDKLVEVETQLAWMRDAGFAHVDCIWKWRGFALLAGRRTE